jgi:drug/metabolite transporter (DMT)-like permease
LLSALLFIVIGDVIHQRSAHAVTDEPVSHIELFMRLLRDGKWWLGGVVAAVGFALQATALGLGSVLLVQAPMVTSLLFALPINALVTRRRVTRWEWTWAALLAAAVAVIVTVGKPTAGHSLASLETWTAVIAVLGPAVVLCVVGARICSGTVSAVLLAVVSGALWGVFAALTEGVVGTPRRRSVGAAAHARAVRVGIGRHCGHGLAAVVVPRRRADRIAADHDRRGCGGGGRDGRTGPRRGGRCPQATRVSTSLGAC